MENSEGLLVSVITTVQPPTKSVAALSANLRGLNAPLVIVGDRKGPASYQLEGATFLDLQSQVEGPFVLGRELPASHYSRKNIGYLNAIARAANCIYETDDDNAPSSDWKLREAEIDVHRIDCGGWVNAFRCFSSELIWPRGFPLDEIARSFRAIPMSARPERIRAPIQQGLADGSPDVDAVWRLVLDTPFKFESGPSVVLSPGSWSPFNSQSTWWWPEAFPLLYLPSRCPFRMTDIWRSFVAQRCLWEMGYGVVFHAPEVVQDRNPHDLMQDFNDELPGYQRNREFTSVLEDLALLPGKSNAGANLRTCYAALINRSCFP